MKVENMNWMQIEEYLKNDDRAILSMGSTEQHAYISLCTDYILATKLAEDIGHKKNIVVFPGLAYGISPYFMAYPGTVTIKPETFFAYFIDILNSLSKHGFRRFFIVNGHGGNIPIQSAFNHWIYENQYAQIILYNWWSETEVKKKMDEVSDIGSHASWMETFPWTKIQDVKLPEHKKPLVDVSALSYCGPNYVREIIEEGNFGGEFFKSDKEMFDIWNTALHDGINKIENGWH